MIIVFSLGGVHVRVCEREEVCERTVLGDTAPILND